VLKAEIMHTSFMAGPCILLVLIAFYLNLKISYEIGELVLSPLGAL
jgi:hypothetical protein